jgi:hypothetical protein
MIQRGVGAKIRDQRASAIALANCVRDFEGMALPLRPVSNMYQAAKRGCMIVGSDRECVPLLYFALRFDSPDDACPAESVVLARRQGRRFSPRFAGGFAVNARVERKCLMGRMNWSRIATRDRMRRQGVEDVKGKMPLVVEPPKQPRRKLSKGEVRQQAAAAFLAWRAGQTSKNK